MLGVSPKIVGGTPAGNGKYPSYGFNAGDVGLCGGTLIHPDIVMTAAHCSKEFADGWYQGGNTVNGAASEFAAVALEFPHPNYEPGPENNDIMLLKLANPLSSTPLQSVNYDPDFPPVVRSLKSRVIQNS